MKITRIVLKGFKRFALSSTKEIEIEFTGKLVLLIGTNGSGKSSLLKELSPLPANVNDFDKGGYKRIEIEHMSSTYTLSSTFDSTGSKFSFMCNGEELNQSFTVTVYKELVYKHFSIDSTVFNMLVNEESFIYYSNQERKAWVTRLSNNDLTYAISYYNKCKEILRDTTGSVKLNKTKLLQETDKLIVKEEYSSLKELIDDSTRLIDKLLEYRDGSTLDPYKIKAAVEGLESRIKEVSGTLTGMVVSYPEGDLYRSVESIDTENIRVVARLAHLQESIKDYSSKLVTITDKLSVLQKANTGTRESLLERITSIGKDIASVQKTILLPVYYNKADDALSSFNTIRSTLEEISLNLTIGTDRLLTKDVYGAKLKDYNVLLAKTNSLEEVHTITVAKIQQMDTLKKDSSVICPKCTHSWYTNYDELLYTSTIDRRERTSKELEVCKKELDRFTEELTSLKEHLTYMHHYTTLCGNWPVLQPLWSYIDDTKVLYTEPRKLLQLMDDVAADLKAQMELDRLATTNQELSDALSLLDKDSVLTLASLEYEYVTHNKHLGDLTTEARDMSVKLNTLKSVRATLVSMDTTKNLLGSLLREYKASMGTVVLYKRKQAINEIVRSIKLYIADKESLIAKQDIQLAIVDNLKATIQDQEESVSYYKSIERTLSPTEGLIAKSLTGFINVFIQQVNIFITKVWTYPLELLPIEIDETLDINYKFKVRVNDVVTVVDIARLSSAQKEIVDLAIRIVSMKYLDIAEYPLYLDEFAARMDVEHRRSAFTAINNIAVNSNFSQVFLVTHLLDEISSSSKIQTIDLSKT